jgi:lipopolysaccharide/colanic/teichoic acid biosynthesis glycosyltransferase
MPQGLPHGVHPSTTSRIKRAIDIVGALVGLGIVALLMVPLAIAIRWDSSGPVFYSQTRCGLNGKPFRIWKFRTMVPNAEQLKATVPNQAQGLIFKNEADPRITRLGKFLRRTSLDEFPQFWNVLTGEMSLVGTRPPTLDEVVQYQPHHWPRLQVKPGITGEWQARGRSTIQDFEAIVALDLRYQSRWSVAYDILLIFTTIMSVLLRKGAC